MKHKVLILFVLLFILASFPVYGLYSPQNLELSSESAVVIDATSGDILYEKNSHKLMFPASTTKIMTAVLTLENTSINDKVIIDKETPFTDGSRIYVIEDEEFTVEQLLHALLVGSANDVAVALAKHVSGSVEDFASLMNKRAKELGAMNTHFVNPNGLPHNDHITTAYDLAMIGKYAMTLPEFRKIVNTINYQIPPTNKQPEIRYLRNTNRLLWGVGGRNKINYNGEWIDIKYDIVDGIKTGYTNAAQQCLISTAMKDDRRLISVVLKAISTDVYLDTRKLLDYGFENFKVLDIVDAGEFIQAVEVPNGQVESVDLITQGSITKTLPLSSHLNDIKADISISEDIDAPISKGQVLGRVTYKLNGELLGETNLLAKDTIEEKAVNKIIRRAKSKKNISLIKFLIVVVISYIIWRIFVTYTRLNRGYFRK